MGQLIICCPSDIVEEAKHQRDQCQNKINFLQVKGGLPECSWYNSNPWSLLKDYCDFCKIQLFLWKTKLW